MILLLKKALLPPPPRRFHHQLGDKPRVYQAHYPSVLDDVLFKTNKLHYITCLAPHCTRLKGYSAFRLKFLQRKINAKIRKEKYLYIKIQKKEDEVTFFQRLLDKNRANNKNNHSLENKVIKLYDEIDNLKIKYDKKVEKHRKQVTSFTEDISSITKDCFSQGIITLEMYQAISSGKSTEELTPEDFLPSYKHVIQAKKIEKAKSFQERQLRELLYSPPTSPESTPPSYEEALQSPPAYSLQEESQV